MCGKSNKGKEMISKNSWMERGYSWRERGWLNWVGHPGFLWCKRSNGWWGMPRVHCQPQYSLYIHIKTIAKSPTRNMECKKSKVK